MGVLVTRPPRAERPLTRTFPPRPNRPSSRIPQAIRPPVKGTSERWVGSRRGQYAGTRWHTGNRSSTPSFASRKEFRMSQLKKTAAVAGVLYLAHVRLDPDSLPVRSTARCRIHRRPWPRHCRHRRRHPGTLSATASQCGTDHTLVRRRPPPTALRRSQGRTQSVDRPIVRPPWVLAARRGWSLVPDLRTGPGARSALSTARFHLKHGLRAHRNRN